MAFKTRFSCRNSQKPNFDLSFKLCYIATERRKSYANSINLEKARQYAENDQQRKVIDLLVKYYETGDLSVFDDYSIEWLKETEGKIDFINGFIEVYGDPLGLKGSWEGLLEMVDEEATKRCQKISDNAQWFEDHSPVDERFRKAEVKGVVAKAEIGRAHV